VVAVLNERQQRETGEAMDSNELLGALDRIASAQERANKLHALDLEYRYRLGAASASRRQVALASAAAFKLWDIMDGLELDGVTDKFDVRE
jgi:hypothetical protein